jgi:hypothetical protein
MAALKFRGLTVFRYVASILPDHNQLKNRFLAQLTLDFKNVDFWDGAKEKWMER